jgi:hypothetical protein
MDIVSIDDAIDELAFAETGYANKWRRKQAFKLIDTAIVAYVSTEYDDVEGAGRYELAEEIILSAVVAGRFRLLARKATDRPKNSVFLETVKLSEVDPEGIRQGTFDRVDGELILFPADDKQSELVDLHLYADEVAASTRELRQFRVAGQGGEYMAHATVNDSPDAPLDSDKLTVSAETRCADWFQKSVAEEADEDDAASKGRMLAEALHLFPGLSKRGFLRVWDRYAPIPWKKAGRKPGARRS